MEKSCSASLLQCDGHDLAQSIKPISSTTRSSLTKRHTKISIIGTGNVGMAIAQIILTQHLTDELALVASTPTKLRGEMLDLQHAAAFLPQIKIVASVDYSVTAGSDICIVTAGARVGQGETTRMALCERNVAIFKNIIPLIVKYSPDTILLIATNPVDVLTYVAWRLSGLPPNRVIGSGTNVDSSRFRFLIAEEFDINAQDVQAYIIGEHGDTAVPVWSSVSVGGVQILNFLKEQEIPYEEALLENIGKEVIETPLEVIRLKGYTSWAIAYAVANIAQAIIQDQRSTHPVSVLAKGFYDINGGDVFLSLLAQLGRDGIVGVAKLPLNGKESQLLLKSAKYLLDVQNQLEL